MLLHVSERHSFLQPNNIPLYRQTTFCSFIHLLMDTWAVSIFCLLCALETCRSRQVGPSWYFWEG
jgi:hypothetical protein